MSLFTPADSAVLKKLVQIKYQHSHPLVEWFLKCGPQNGTTASPSGDIEKGSLPRPRPIDVGQGFRAQRPEVQQGPRVGAKPWRD